MRAAFAVAALAAGLFAAASAASAATIQAASTAFTDVSNAVASASPGDTVVLPPGTNAWSSQLTIGSITLQGSGTNCTVIVDETPPVGNGTALMQLSVTSSVLTRVTGIQFTHGVTNNLTFDNYYGSIVIYGANPSWRIDHCFFNVMSSKAVHVGDDAFGLIDHNVFLTFNRISIEIFGTGYGDAAWAAPTQFGSANAVYIEDNYFSDGNNFGLVDVSGGARAVFRHNTMIGSYFNTHGTETTQRYRSSRYVEVYQNNFTYMTPPDWQNFYAMCDIRGGSAVIFSNTAAGYWSVGSLNYYRATDNDTGFTPWFGATGISGWDSNSPPLLTGVNSTGVQLTNLIVPGANWTNNQWFGCTVLNSNTQLMGIVTGNNSNTLFFMPSRRAWLQVNFAPGDTFVVRTVYPMLDQPGMGPGDLISGDTPAPVWPHQASEPIYAWGNAQYLNQGTLNPASGNIGSSYPNILEGRDFFNAVKPGYTNYVYPHPLNVDVPALTATILTATNSPDASATNTNSVSGSTGDSSSTTNSPSGDSSTNSAPVVPAVIKPTPPSDLTPHPAGT